MSAIAFDIETIGEDWDTLDETTQDVLAYWIRKDSASESEYKHALEDLKNGLGFSPLTGSVVAIGVLDTEKDKGVVYFQAPGSKIKLFEENGITFKPMTEKEMLEHFWEGVKEYEEFVTFNGRGFDVPFLMTRSAVHGVHPSKDLMSNRYTSLQKFGARHIDLMDQLSFYGAVRKKGGLHLWARAFGIESPKAEGVTGDDVSELFHTGRFEDIARYNVRDIRATAELYKVWQKYFKF